MHFKYNVSVVVLEIKHILIIRTIFKISVLLVSDVHCINYEPHKICIASMENNNPALEVPTVK